jgi:hypothetical protein
MGLAGIAAATSETLAIFVAIARQRESMFIAGI